MAGEHDPYAALRHSGYRGLLAGNMLASMGTQMQRVAIGWELYQRTHDAGALGYVGLIQFLPVVFLSLPAGHLADRYSRKGILISAQGVGALASLGLAALSFRQGPIALIYVCLLGVGISRAFNMPARSALLQQLVPDAALSNAITWNSSGWQVASMVGPALGGLVLAAGGWAVWVYLLTALCALTAIGLFTLMQPRPVARVAKGISLNSFLAGVRFVLRTKLILATMTLDLFAVLFGGANALLPVYAADILQVGAAGLGLLDLAPSLGALGMAMFLAHRPPLRRAGPALLLAVSGFGLAWVVFGLSRSMVLSFAMLVLTGALDNISIVVRGTLVQVLTPDEMRGRVSAVNAIFIGSSNELGGFESGITAKYFGPVASVVGGGIGTVFVVAGVMAAWPQVLRLGALHRAGQEPEEALAAAAVAEDVEAESRGRP